MSVRRERLNRCVDLARRLGITARDVERFEDCERVADMLQDEHIDAIRDEGLRRVVRQMRGEHSPIRASQSSSFARKAEALFALLPRPDAVIDYHSLEQELEAVGDGEIGSVEDRGMRELLHSIKHVHGAGHGRRKAEIFREIVDPPARESP